MRARRGQPKRGHGGGKETSGGEETGGGEKTSGGQVLCRGENRASWQVDARPHCIRARGLRTHVSSADSLGSVSLDTNKNHPADPQGGYETTEMSRCRVRRPPRPARVGSPSRIPRLHQHPQPQIAWSPRACAPPAWLS